MLARKKRAYRHTRECEAYSNYMSALTQSDDEHARLRKCCQPVITQQQLAALQPGRRAAGIWGGQGADASAWYIVSVVSYCTGRQDTANQRLCHWTMRRRQFPVAPSQLFFSVQLLFDS